MTYRMAPVLVTLNDLEGHSPIAGLFRCNPSNICAVFYQISTTARSLGPSAIAGLLVLSVAVLWAWPDTSNNFCSIYACGSSEFMLHVYDGLIACI